MTSKEHSNEKQIMGFTITLVQAGLLNSCVWHDARYQAFLNLFNLIDSVWIISCHYSQELFSTQGLNGLRPGKNLVTNNSKQGYLSHLQILDTVTD